MSARSSLFHNVHERFADVGKASAPTSHFAGQDASAADLNGDSHTDLMTAASAVLCSGMTDGPVQRRGRHSRLASVHRAERLCSDVNGDGRPDLFIAGYADPDPRSGTPQAASRAPSWPSATSST